jgi:NAD(P)-dependent dehydrogenase (short-subunit alcohol dehydrogenase family)
MSGILSGRTALVTGTAGGIGGAIAAEFVEQGATVIGLDRVQGGPVDVLVTDLANTDSLDEVVAEANRRLGSIDILVNCAGTFTPETVQETTWAAYDRTLRINLHAPVFLMSRVSRLMAAAKYGRILNITSIHSRLSEPLSLAYDISKAGLEAATRTFALELAHDGVLANSLAPGFVSTQMSIVDGVNELESDWFKTIYVENGKLPLGRAAQPSEIAKHVSFLCSDRNTYMTGEAIIVDGGVSARF